MDGHFIDEMQADGASYRIYALYEDREGSLWVGSEAGLARLTPKLFQAYTMREGLTKNTIASICACRDGGIWIGTWGGGLNELKDGKVTAYTRANDLPSDFVVAVHEAREGGLWFATRYAPGVNRLHDGRVTHFPALRDQVGSVINTLLEDAEGNVWLGSRQGLSCFRAGHRSADIPVRESSPASTADRNVRAPLQPPGQSGGTFVRYTTQDGLSDDKINALCAGSGGSIWIGTEAGLTQGRKGRFTPVAAGSPLAHAVVLSLYQDPAGTLWIGTRGAGLVRLRGEKFERFGRAQGFLSDSIYSILEDDHHNLWLNSSRGIFRVSKRALEGESSGGSPALNCVSYGKGDGIISSGQSWPPWYQFDQYQDAIQPAACKGADGRLWFVTTQGVAVVDPAGVRDNEQPPPVVIEEVLADRRPVRGLGSHAEDQPASSSGVNLAQQTLDIAPGRGELEIRYAVLSLRAPEKNRVRYRLQEVDPEWVDAAGRRVAYYHRLAPGTYRFQVAACNNDGVWNEAGAAVTLKLRPHVWQTWWFLGLCCVSAAGAVGGAARYATRKKLQRQVERLEQQHAIERERARIARDMHDELGAKLTHISFQGASALRSLAEPAAAQQHIGNMAKTARALVGSLDEIVWAVDPENDSLENLANYICRYAGEFFENSPVACEFSIPADLPERRLAADVRHNVFLAVKEALNNVLKHSSATHAHIRLTVGPREFDILIADDGQGIKPETSSGTSASKATRAGHGLGNIRQRLAAINGWCEIESGQGKGTRVRLVVPIEEMLKR